MEEALQFTLNYKNAATQTSFLLELCWFICLLGSDCASAGGETGAWKLLSNTDFH